MRSLPSTWPLLALLFADVAPVGCGLHGKPSVERKDAPSASRPETARGEPASDEAPRSTAERVEADHVVAPGIVEPWGDQVELSAQEPGWIDRILVAEGQGVEQGQLLAQLEDAAQRHAVALARAEVEDATAGLAKLEHGATAEELRQARGQRSAAAVRAKLARSDADRISKIHEGGAAPEADADRASAEAQSATALAEVAEARVRELERGARAEDRASARARLSAARARQQLAEAALNRRRLVAPSKGTVLLSRFQPGEFFEFSRGPLFLLGDVSRFQVRLEVDEIDSLAIRPGAPCTLYSDSGELLGRGVVFRLAPRMGRRSLPMESPTARTDVRVREVFVDVAATVEMLPGQRVWGHTERAVKAVLQAQREDARGPDEAGGSQRRSSSSTKPSRR